MACQSMDNDEILNVRWATEDPNPTTKVSEKRRLEEIGQEAIKARMDNGIVSAMRSLRALEDGEPPPEEDDYPSDDDQRASKRQRLENFAPDVQEQEEMPEAKGLLSADTLEGLKYFAEIRQRNGAFAPVPARAPVPSSAPTGVLALADYGSDEED